MPGGGLALLIVWSAGLDLLLICPLGLVLTFCVSETVEPYVLEGLDENALDPV